MLFSYTHVGNVAFILLANNNERNLQEKSLAGIRTRPDTKLTYLNVFSILIHYHYFDDEVLDMCRDGLLTNVFNQVTELHRQAFVALKWRCKFDRSFDGRGTHLLFPDERTPQHADTLADHADLQLVLGPEPLDHLLQRGIVLELETIPKRPLSGTVFVLRCRNRFGEPEEWECEIDKAILVILEFPFPVDNLV